MTSTQSDHGPLGGVRVLDFSTVYAGPITAMLLGDFGADVLKIELPTGDPARTHGWSVQDRQGIQHGLWWKVIARNKEAMTLDVRTPEGREIMLKLVAEADVMTENFRPGVLEGWGLGPDELHAVNPRLVLLRTTGFGQDGPYASLPGHDLSYLAQTGALAMLTPRGAGPVIPQNIVADYAGGGLVAAVGVLAALLARQRTGVGQHVDAALTDGVLYVLADLLSSWFGFAVTPELGESAVSGALPGYSVYETRDGHHLAIACLEPWFFRALCDAVGRPELTPLFSDPGRRDEVRSELAAVFATRTRDEWFAILAGADVAVGRVLGLEELATDPQLQARNMIIDVARSEGPPVRMVGVAPKLSDTPGSVRSAPFHRGRDTDAILAELGVHDGELAELRARGAIA